MKRVIVPAALAELQDAAAFYTSTANVSLGLAFVAEFARCMNIILANPDSGAALRGPSRRYLFRRFPYSVIYHVVHDQLRVIAVARQHRRPGYRARRE